MNAPAHDPRFSVKVFDYPAGAFEVTADTWELLIVEFVDAWASAALYWLEQQGGGDSLAIDGYRLLMDGYCIDGDKDYVASRNGYKYDPEQLAKFESDAQTEAERRGLPDPFGDPDDITGSLEESMFEWARKHFIRDQAKMRR